MEELHTRIGDEASGLAVIWWDPQARGYRVIWCGSANPRGCVVMSQLALWDESQFVVRDEFVRGGTKVVYREVFSELRSTSFTQTVFQGDSGQPLKPVVTIHATRLANRPSQ